MNVLVAHPGTQHAPRLAAELAARKRLHGFWTGLAFAEDGSAARVIRRFAPASRLATRICPGVSAAQLHSRPLLELTALARLRRGGNPEAVFHSRNAAWQTAVPETALRESAATIGFDTSSWILAERCRLLNRRFLLDRTIGHPDRLQRELKELAQRYPEWLGGPATRDVNVRAAEEQEHALAHRIVVGGSFARTTLLEAGVAEDRIRVNPYGVDPAAFARSAPPGNDKRRPLHFLFAGTVSARKGVPVLLEAWAAANLPDAELWIAGHIERRLRPLIPELRGLRLLGHVPRAQMPDLYAQADVFVLPSVFEGFGLVLLEAVAAGLPVITTPHTGGADFLPHPDLGQLVDAGSVDALVAALRRWANYPPDPVTVRASAMSLLERFSWGAYGERWIRILDES